MTHILIVAAESAEIRELASGLARAGFKSTGATAAEAEQKLTQSPPDLVLWQPPAGTIPDDRLERLLDDTGTRKIPFIMLVARDRLADIHPDLPVVDFIVTPCDPRELVLRIKRQLGTSTEDTGYIRAGELVIDSGKAEIMVSGDRVELTFREYELLRFLAGNQGRVFTREALLNRVWGYEYYGGDRTVDVHIRRLRSKIETDKLTFIETVRNIGYRFRDDLEATII